MLYNVPGPVNLCSSCNLVKISNHSASPFGYNICLILKLYIETVEWDCSDCLTVQQKRFLIGTKFCLKGRFREHKYHVLGL